MHESALDYLVRCLTAHEAEMAAWLGLPARAIPADAPALLACALLEQAASGVLDLDADYERVSDAYDLVLAALTVSAANVILIDSTFWRTPAGWLLARVRVWLDGDELITLSEAARLVRGEASNASRRWINEQIQRGRLIRYVDPTEPNPTRAGRVSRLAVLALASQR